MGDRVHRLLPNIVQLVLHNMQFTFVSIFTSTIEARACMHACTLNDYPDQGMLPNTYLIATGEKRK